MPPPIRRKGKKKAPAPAPEPSGGTSALDADTLGFADQEEAARRKAEAEAKKVADRKAAQAAALRGDDTTGLFSKASAGVEDEKEELAAATISLFTTGTVEVESAENVFGGAMEGEFKAIEEEERKASEAAAAASEE